MSTNDTNKKLHHANVVIGGDSRNFVFDILEKNLNFNIKANPDFLLIESESFGIDDARNLEKWVLGKPLLSDTKAALIATAVITHEAQNALLKVLEEPPLGTYIFISIQSLGGLLPTFLSRVRILNFSSKENISNNADKFFNSKINDRFYMVRSLTKSEDKTSMKELIKNLEEICYKNCVKDITNAKAEMAKNILTAKIFASTRGSSPKMLLEWLSCVIPSSEF
jgi:DNA polymerase III gamma/tau subunit